MCRFEPAGSELLDIEPEATLLNDKVGWGDIFRSFDGHDIEVTHRFSLYFKENVAQIRDLRLVIYEDFVAKATKLPQTAEKWFKRGEINKTKWKQFLLPLPSNFDDKFGFPAKYLNL